MNLALVCMTINGAEKLPRLFQSVAGFVDQAIILDTGSTDTSVAWLAGQTDKPMPGFPVALYQEPFVNFEVSRTRLNELAVGKADWLLLLDNDMALDFESVNRARVRRILETTAPEVNGYLLRHAGANAYWNTRFVRGDRLWKYKGATHEYIEVDPVPLKLEGLVVEHFYNHGPEKFIRDLQLLTADIARDPDNARTIFYIANTLRDLGKTPAAIRFYCMRAKMGGWDEEIWNAMFEAARLARNPDWMKITFSFRPCRAEAAAWLSKYYEAEGDIAQSIVWEDRRAALSVPNDILFVNTKCYGKNNHTDPVT